MYTEDDEKVKVKKNDSNNDYDDFYNAFNTTEADNEEKKKEKNTEKKKTPPKKEKEKKEKKEKKEESEETEYSYFYVNNEDEFPQTDKKNLKKIIIICGIAILAIILVVLSFVIIKSVTKKDIELLNENMSIKVGESDYLSYKIVNEDVGEEFSFVSSDESIATVNENGLVTGISGGNVTISFNYQVNGRKRTKEINVTIVGEPISDDITMNITYSSGSSDTWTNQDVKLSIETTGYVSSIRYAVNCSGECNYKEVTNNEIIITDNGVNNVKVVANGRNNKEVTKEVVVKLDKEMPKAVINNKNVVSNDSVEVCATCSDSVSGCSKEKVCKRYTTSQKNQVISVSDNAGNEANSPLFNVTINKTEDPCTLSVSPDGVVTATVKGEASYYGFNSGYTGKNELSKKIDINATKNGETFAKVVFYFVKNTNGSGGKCYITVIKECKCSNSSNSSNCPVTCTFRKG